MASDSAGQTTVVIPVWDAYIGERLDEALASVQGQVPAPSVVIVDNASREELRAQAGVDVLRSASRVSVGEARNLGLSRVSSPYVVFWDADDVMLPGTIEFLEQGISREPGSVAFATAMIEEPSGLRHRWPRRWVGALVRAPRLFALLDSVWSVYPTTGATIIRTQAAKSAGGYGAGDSGEDWCLGVSLAFRGRIQWSERPGRIYRVHEESVWARHMTIRHQFRHAHAVRMRIREDPEIPRWARSALPVIQLGQYTAIALHAALAAGRRAGLSRSTGGR